MKLIPNAVTVKFARQLLVTQKHSPAILFGAGIVGIVGSTVLACRATLKLEEVLQAAETDLTVSSLMVEDDEYSKIDHKKDVGFIYIRSAATVGKLYAPAIVLGTVSIGALTASHTILTRRNVALTAAYAAIERGFSEYRARVVEKYGEDQDRQFRYSTEVVEITNDKNKKQKVVRASSDAPSIYARFFDESATEWQEEPEYNLMFLKCQQNYANDLLRSRGHVFLNEVYDRLGLERSQAGQAVGWVVGNGDNFIDFGIFDDVDACRDFVNGREGSILLDFNVDGIVWDKLAERKTWLNKAD